MTLTAKLIDEKNDLEDILKIEQTAFDEMASDKTDLRRQLKKGFGYVVADDKNNLGYMIAIPLEKAHYKGCMEDTHNGKNDTTYIESIATTGENPRALLTLLRETERHINKNNIRRMTMHVEKGQPLYKFIQRQGGTEIAQFDDWMGWNRTFSYMELKR